MKIEAPGKMNVTWRVDVRRCSCNPRNCKDRWQPPGKEQKRRGVGLGVGGGELSFIRICVGIGTSLMVQWLRLLHSHAEPVVHPLVREPGPTCRN